MTLHLTVATLHLKIVRNKQLWMFLINVTISYGVFFIYNNNFNLHFISNLKLYLTFLFSTKAEKVFIFKLKGQLYKIRQISVSPQIT